jgi:hypothetical protein
LKPGLAGGAGADGPSVEGGEEGSEIFTVLPSPPAFLAMGAPAAACCRSLVLREEIFSTTNKQSLESCMSAIHCNVLLILFLLNIHYFF